MTDNAIYIRFSRTDDGGTRLIGTRGYNGPRIADLRWARQLSKAEEHELDTAVREGAWLPILADAP